MYQIYQRSVRRAVWLGPAADDSDRLFDQIRRFSEVFLSKRNTAKIYEELGWLIVSRWLSELGPLDDVISVPALSALICRP
jgi:hypothetical protein